ncbi:MAG: DUF952 domain-containing protein [Chloroflexi bacterium]|nr:DUF952 domain-containing protein [Chloroflexota bacterium]
MYHITTRTSWSAAQEAGAYTADSLASQGFIHCSKADQVLRVANAIYRGQTGLVLLEIDLSALRSEVRWEPGTDTVRAVNTLGTPVRDGKPEELFPHIYGPLNLDAVHRVLDFPPGPDGQFRSLPI